MINFIYFDDRKTLSLCLCQGFAIQKSLSIVSLHLQNYYHYYYYYFDDLRINETKMIVFIHLISPFIIKSITWPLGH